MISMTGAVPGHNSGYWVARAATEAFAPAVLTTVLLLLSAFGAQGWPAGLLSAAVVLVFITGGPFTILVVLSRTGRLSDHHVGNRAQRGPVFAGAVVSVLCGLALLALLGAPRQLLALIEATLAGVFLVGFTNLFWKLSAHSAVATFFSAAVIMLYGNSWWPLLLIVPAVGWSRVKLKDHTVAQVVAGTFTGLLIAALFGLLLDA